MIYKKGKLILEIDKNIKEIIKGVEETTHKNIGAIYKGGRLVWLTVYNAIRSCFGSGKWIQDKPWIQDDKWKNNQ